MLQTDQPLALVMTGVWKSYPGVLAVRGADFSCVEGEIHALVGENGAGKSTLMKIASGDVASDAGEIDITGRRLTGADPGLARRLGLGMVYQEDSLIPDLSVAQNFRLGLDATERPSFAEMDDWAEEQLRRFDMPIDVRTPVRDLSVASRQVVEIIKALVAAPRVLVLDEPTSALASNEVDRLHDVLHEVAAKGTTVVYITHRLREVFSLAERVSVMRDGEIVKAGMSVAETSEDELVSLMVGRSFEAAFPPKASAVRKDGDPLLLVEDLHSDHFHDVSIKGYCGEILGIAGIEGNGQREFLRAIVGLGYRKGTVTVGDSVVPAGDVTIARQRGIVFISGDRRDEGLFMGLGVRENMTVTSLQRYANHGLISARIEHDAVEKQLRALAVRTPNQEQTVSALSGGNQQKVVLGRAFLDAPKVYAVEEPTQGVDAATRLEIYDHLRSAADAGALVLVLSSDAVELAGLCDRVAVFVRGEIINELSGESLTEDSVVGTAVRSGKHRANLMPEQGTGNLLHLLRTGDFLPVALLLFSILAIAGATGMARPLFFTSTNFGNLLLLTVPLGFAALAQALVMLVGGIDLSIGPLVALVTVAMAQIMNPEIGSESALPAVGASLAIGLAIGAINGFLVLRVHLIPLIATLATYVFVQGIALLWSPVTGGYVAPAFSEVAKFKIGSIPWAFLFLAFMAIAGEFVYRRSAFGMVFRAVGSRPTAAERLGIHTNIVHYVAYMSAGVLGAIAGIFFTSTIGIGDPRLGISFTLASITAVVLGGLSTWGGRGSVVGPLLGAILLALISNVSAFMNFPSEVQYYAQGGLMIVAIAVYSRMRATDRNLDETAVK